MALLNECMQSCARIVLDTADIVRERYFANRLSTNKRQSWPRTHCTFSVMLVVCDTGPAVPVIVSV